MKAWYTESFGLDYLEIYAHRDEREAREDVANIVKLIDPPKNHLLLDLGCGAGRHLRAFRESGFRRLLGLDLSKDLLHVAEQALGSNAALICADMRQIPLESNSIATVVSLFTSFGYFQDDCDNAEVLVAVHRILRPEGTFLLDYMNRDWVLNNLVPQDECTLPSGRHILNIRQQSPDGRRVEKTVIVTEHDGSRRTFHESVRLYTPVELQRMLRNAGFTHLACYGSLKGEPFSSASQRLVIVAKNL